MSDIKYRNNSFYKINYFNGNSEGKFPKGRFAVK